MSETWIVVADSSRARILSPADEEPQVLDEIIHYVGRAGYAGPEKVSSPPIQEIADLVHPASRAKPQEIETDHGGQFQGSAANTPDDTRHVDFDHQRAEEFAGEVIDYLIKSHQQNLFQVLILVAPPRFLGVLRKHLPKTLSELVADEINREYTLLSAQKIQEHIAKRHAK